MTTTAWPLAKHLLVVEIVRVAEKGPLGRLRAKSRVVEAVLVEEANKMSATGIRMTLVETVLMILKRMVVLTMRVLRMEGMTIALVAVALIEAVSVTMMPVLMMVKRRVREKVSLTVPRQGKKTNLIQERPKQSRCSVSKRTVN
jgi:hypothetical protein